MTIPYVLKPCNNKQGYPSIVITNKAIKLPSGNSKRVTFFVHQLVAMAFLGHRPDGTQNIVVDHIDNDKQNNNLSNLQLISQRDNTIKSKRRGVSKYVGVCYDFKYQRWTADFWYKKNKIYLGFYDTELKAKNAYDEALLNYKSGLPIKTMIYNRKEQKHYAVYKLAT